MIARRSFQKQKLLLLHVCRLINGLNSINPKSIILQTYNNNNNNTNTNTNSNKFTALDRGVIDISEVYIYIYRHTYILTKTRTLLFSNP